MDEKDKHFLARRPVLLPLFVLICGLAATAFATFLVNENLEFRDRQHLAEARYQIERAIQSRMEAHIALLRGGAGLFAANQFVTLGQFQLFHQRLEIERHYPGLLGVGYSVHFPREKLEELETSMRRQGWEDFKVWPEEERAEYHSIVFLEPQNDQNKRAIGYDMFTNPTRREAMTAARDQGEARLTQIVRLVQELNDGSRHPGFLLYLPLYLGGDVPLEVAERRERLQGFIYSPFRAGDLFTEVARRVNIPTIAFAIWDGSEPTPDNLMFQSSPGFNLKDAQEFSRIQVLGVPWTLAVSDLPGAPRSWIARMLWIVPLLGVVGSILLCYFTYTETRQTRKRRQAERALEETEERFALLVQLAEEYAIIIMGPDGRITTWNTGAQRIFGYTDKEVVGLDGAIFFTGEDREAGVPEKLLRRAEMGEQVVDERWQVRKDGSRIWMSGSSVCLRGAEGTVRGFANILRDITERKQTEESIKELNQELETRVQRRTSALQESKEQMEAFSYTVAHDLRAPLRAMQGFAHALMDDYKNRLESEAVDYLDRIMRSAERMDQLIQDLLEYSRLSGSDLNFRAVSVEEMVRNALERNAEEIRAKKAEVRVTVENGAVKAHPATLENAVSNLVSNGLKFNRPGVPPKIHIRAIDHGNHVQVCVQDNGIGIAPEHHGRIFRVFERLHLEEAFPGTGIGLAIVKKGVERMGGRVGLESEPGKGSLFWIELPKAKG